MILSIIVPTLNSAGTIPRWLDSLTGSLPDELCDSFEVIVVDGFSIDNTIDLIASRLGKLHIPFKVYKQNPEGIYEAIRMGYRVASGLWFIVANSDDEIFGKALAGLIRLLRASHEANRKVSYFFPVIYEGYGIKAAKLQELSGLYDLDVFASSHSVGFCCYREHSYLFENCIQSSKYCVDYNLFLEMLKNSLPVESVSTDPVGKFYLGGFSSNRMVRLMSGLEKKSLLIRYGGYKAILRHLAYHLKRFGRVFRSSNRILLIGGRADNHFNGGQGVSIPELATVLESNGENVLRYPAQSENAARYLVGLIKAILKSRVVILNSDFYRMYPIAVALTCLFCRGLILVPRGAYNKRRVSIRFSKKLYLFFVYFLPRCHIVFLSESERNSATSLISFRGLRRAAVSVVCPSFGYLDAELPITKESRTLLFGGRGPEIYAGKIRDPKGLTVLLSHAPLLNRLATNVELACNVASLDTRLLRIDKLRCRGTLDYASFQKRVAASEFIFQYTSEGEGFSQLIAQCLAFKTRLIVDRESVPAEVIKAAEDNLGYSIPQEFWLTAEYSKQMHTLLMHLSHQFEPIHRALFESFRLQFIVDSRRLAYYHWARVVGPFLD